MRKGAERSTEQRLSVIKWYGVGYVQLDIPMLERCYGRPHGGWWMPITVASETRRTDQAQATS